MKDFVEISITTQDKEQSDILIALLSGNGYEGFEEEDDMLHAYIPAEHFSQENLDQLVQQMDLSYSRKDIPAQNWNELWESNFQPICVHDFCGIRSSFHSSIKGVQYELIITPKMSFGTGHHATTYQMISAMEFQPLDGKWILDFGTGTGVLAILAEKMGAAKVLAIDYDELSIENARENLDVNECHSILLEKRGDLDFEGVYDFILMNINKHVIISNLRFLSQHLTQEGVVIVSGLLTEDQIEIQERLTDHHFSISSSTEKSGWICMQLQRISVGPEPAREC